MKNTVIFGFMAIGVLLVWTMGYSQKIETVGGVRVVHNVKGGKWGKNPEVVIKLVRTIGDVDTEDENLAFNSPTDIAMDSAGNIYILDSGNQRIQKFSPEGRFLFNLSCRPVWGHCPRGDFCCVCQQRFCPKGL